MAFAVLGTLATFAAQLMMGDSWRIGVDETERTTLVTRGPFRLVRNPIFDAVLLAFLGLTLMVPNLLALGGFVLMLVGAQIQVRRVEEPYLRPEPCSLILLTTGWAKSAPPATSGRPPAPAVTHPKVRDNGAMAKTPAQRIRKHGAKAVVPAHQLPPVINPTISRTPERAQSNSNLIVIASVVASLFLFWYLHLLTLNQMTQLSSGMAMPDSLVGGFSAD